MGGTSSARPEELGTFVTKANAVTDDLQTWATKLMASLNAFQSSGSIGTVESGAIQVLPTLLQNQRINALFVDVVREAFLNADAKPGPNGSLTVPDDELQRAFVSAAQARGLDPNLLDQMSPPITVPPTVTGVIPQDSGFVDDPVCTATGHFLEEEVDLVVPARVAILGGTRWYSSRLLAPGPFGRGWWSWASADCRVDDDGAIAYRGPDGREVRLAPDGDGGWHRSPGFEAEIVRASGNAAGELEVRWSAGATWSSHAWTFDGVGRLQAITAPTLGTTTFAHDDTGRLVTASHDGGRTLTYEWRGEGADARIVALHSSDGRAVTYDYDERGDLALVHRATGDRTYAADERGRIVTVHDADGVRLCHNTYDDAGRVLAQVSPLGRETHFQYLAGRLTRVSDTAGGPVAVFEHDDVGRMVGLIDADGHRFSRSFDDRGRVEHQQTFDGSTLQRSFDETVDGHDTVELTTADGAPERWTYDDAGRVLAHRRSDREGDRELTYKYDGDSMMPARIDGPLGWSMTYRWDRGIPTAVTDADGVSVTFTHDPEGNVTETVDGLGHVTRFDWHVTGRPAAVHHSDGETQRLTWDDGGRLLSLIDPSGAEARFEHTPAGRLAATIDPEGARTEIVYDTTGFASSTIDPMGNTVEWRRDQFEHLVGFTNPDGGKWELAYSHLGQLSLISGPDGSTWSTTLDPEGRIVELVDPLGGATRTTYDTAGRLSSVTDEVGAERGFTYDSIGHLVAQTDPLGAVTRQAVDALDRVTEVVDADGVTSTCTYTAAGRIATATDGLGHTTRYGYDAAGRQVTVQSPQAETTTTTYDARGRVVATTSPEGRATTYSYAPSGAVDSVRRGSSVWRWRHDRSGRVVAAIDPLGATVRYRYDAGGRLVTAIDARNQQTNYRYDAMGQLVAVVDPFGRSTTTEWDLMGRPVLSTDPLGRTTQLAFDANGRVRRSIDADGTVFEHRRDARGAATALVVDDIEAIRYHRDPLGRLLSVEEPDHDRRHELDWSPAGRLRSATNAARVLQYQHDVAGRLTGRTAIVGGDVLLDESWQLDGNGRAVQLDSHPFGAVTLERDRDGRLVALAADGLTRAWVYDDQGRLTTAAQTIDASTTTTTTTTTTTLLTRDAAGRIERTDTDGAVTAFAYDAAGQLVEITAPDGAPSTFGYDAAGRLVTETANGATTTYEYDAAGQLVAAGRPDGVTRFTFDAAGRRTHESGPAHDRAFSWDRLGRLTSITDDGRSTAVDVDALGQLARVDDTELWWDPTRPTSPPIAIGGQLIGALGGQVLATSSTGDLDRVGADWRGNVVDRDAWGRPTSADDVDGPAVGLGFAGEVEIDGLVWLRARLYDPSTAAFLSPDPLAPVPASAVAANPYHYGANDPLGMVDPLGLRPVSIDDYNAARDKATGVQWGNIAKVAVVVGGVALTIACPALGPVALGLLGAGMGAAPGVIDGIQTGHWDVGAITKGALVGGVTGVAGAYIPGAGGLGQSLLQGGAMGAGAGALNEAYDLTSLPGSDHSFDVANVATATLLGTAGGGLGHGLGAMRSPGDPPELFYRGMSNAEHEALQQNGGLTIRQTESFVTQDRGYVDQLAARYPDKYPVTVEFKMQPGTQDALVQAGARDAALSKTMADAGHADLPVIQKGQTDIVHVKGEGPSVNYGLRQDSVQIFNDRIVTHGPG